ncbi:hypothetical protein GCM10022233_70450 [Streptomyces shaanxiensis]|uniref:Uncharacterized protein n=1 Tax=Streptomyces shaanxiensis TaxID=653357 RepID=A0ABP7W3D1_9ACTN
MGMAAEDDAARARNRAQLYAPPKGACRRPADGARPRTAARMDPSRAGELVRGSVATSRPVVRLVLSDEGSARLAQRQNDKEPLTCGCRKIEARAGTDRKIRKGLGSLDAVDRPRPHLRRRTGRGGRLRRARPPAADVWLSLLPGLVVLVRRRAL